MLTYSELMEALRFGHEVEFNIGTEAYSITQSQDGWHYTVVSDYENDLTFDTTEELLMHVRIEQLTLHEICDSGCITDCTIY